jgi:hypothetical protein
LALTSIIRELYLVCNYNSNSSAGSFYCICGTLLYFINTGQSTGHNLSRINLKAREGQHSRRQIIVRYHLRRVNQPGA